MPQQSQSERPRPEVLIIGAGIGGLTLAILLEQINIPYHIYERASEVKPLGSAMSFTGEIFPALEQLGIYEELKNVSKPYDYVDFCNEDLKKLGFFDTRMHTEATGYAPLIFARPKLYNILRGRVPDQRISFNKKVHYIEEKEGKVTIHCSDDTSYTGDILVGADGAYSGVRQSMYKQMDEQDILPKSDLEDFSIGYATIVGIATPSNPDKYPLLKEENSSFNQVIYKGGSNCYVVTLPDNQISWGFGLQLPKSTLKEVQSRNSEWSPETNDKTLDRYRDLLCPLGGTMGEIFDATPKHLISKIFLEEKMFKSWYHGNTVLIGDACHKFHPSAGQGARSAIFDAVTLANCIYSMRDSSSKSIGAAFKEYHRQRYHQAVISYNESVMMSKLLNGQRWHERLLRHVFLNYIPTWMRKSQILKDKAYRPQIAWLPLIKNRGNGPVLPQEFGMENAAAPVSV